jgi:hypothetical protein
MTPSEDGSMKLRPMLSLLTVLAAVAWSAAPASGQNLSGTWQISVENGRGGTMTQTLTLTQDGSTVTGSIDMQGGRGRGGGGGGGPVTISEGTVDGASFRFVVAFEGGGRGPVQLIFAGTYESDFMEGTIEGGPAGARPFMGTRAD